MAGTKRSATKGSGKRAAVGRAVGTNKPLARKAAASQKPSKAGTAKAGTSPTSTAKSGAKTVAGASGVKKRVASVLSGAREIARGVAKKADPKGKVATNPRSAEAHPNAIAVAARLERAIPEALCELRFGNAFELLIATILSAQSTDKMVNTVMPELLARFPTPQGLAAADQEEVEQLVKRTGFFRNKAKAIRGAAAQLVEQHGGEVPRTLESLVELPGVARKTANVVLGTAYRIPTGFVVDTHVTRVAQRLALSAESDPVRIEQTLCELVPRDKWIDTGHRMVLHGRYTCLARTPMCSDCPLNELCPSRLAPAAESWETRAAHEATRVSVGYAASGASQTARDA
jgi:endonuclease III